LSRMQGVRRNVNVNKSLDTPGVDAGAIGEGASVAWELHRYKRRLRRFKRRAPRDSEQPLHAGVSPLLIPTSRMTSHKQSLNKSVFSAGVLHSFTCEPPTRRWQVCSEMDPLTKGRWRHLTEYTSVTKRKESSENCRKKAGSRAVATGHLVSRSAWSHTIAPNVCGTSCVTMSSKNL
jgi:hypothetical protein